MDLLSFPPGTGAFLAQSSALLDKPDSQPASCPEPLMDHDWQQMASPTSLTPLQPVPHPGSSPGPRAPNRERDKTSVGPFFVQQLLGSRNFRGMWDREAYLLKGSLA